MTEYTAICRKRKEELSALRAARKATDGMTFMAHVYDAVPQAAAGSLVVHGNVNVSSQYGIVRGTNYGRVGGHNPLEPAHYGKIIITGKSKEKNAFEFYNLKRIGLVKEALNYQDLEGKVSYFLKNNNLKFLLYFEQVYNDL